MRPQDREESSEESCKDVSISYIGKPESEDDREGGDQVFLEYHFGFKNIF